jgi:hypothetical protein
VYLLDTNVLSELRKKQPDHKVEIWARTQDASHWYLSIITLLELEVGAKRKERQDPPQGALLRLWLDTQVWPLFEKRIFPVDAAIIRCAAGLQVPDPMPYGDSLIAATALVHGLTLVTRNTKDFVRTGAILPNPWLV